MKATYQIPYIKAEIGSPIPKPKYVDYLWITPAENEVIKIGLARYGGSDAIEINYKLDNGIWMPYKVGDMISLSYGHKIYWKGNNNHFSKDYNNYYYFSTYDRKHGSRYKINIGGDITTLLSEDGNVSDLRNYGSGIFQKLFYSEYDFMGSDIIDASQLKLPSTSLSDRCYGAMFHGNSTLTNAPELPATTLTPYCYSSMFSGCSSLTTVPALPATTLAQECYEYMFGECTNLTTVPKLPAILLAIGCYDLMFYNCTSLKVYSESGEGHDKEWTIPTEGTITDRTQYWMYNMFKGVETDNVPQVIIFKEGSPYQFYTQNEPV